MIIGTECFLLKKNGNFMPGIYCGDGEAPHLCIVRSRSGREYSCQRSNVVDDQSARAILARRREDKEQAEQRDRQQAEIERRREWVRANIGRDF